jgi:hypothetical protein
LEGVDAEITGTRASDNEGVLESDVREAAASEDEMDGKSVVATVTRITETDPLRVVRVDGDTKGTGEWLETIKGAEELIGGGDVDGCVVVAFVWEVEVAETIEH